MFLFFLLSDNQLWIPNRGPCLRSKVSTTLRSNERHAASVLSLPLMEKDRIRWVSRFQICNVSLEACKAFTKDIPASLSWSLFDPRYEYIFVLTRCSSNRVDTSCSNEDKIARERSRREWKEIRYDTIRYATVKLLRLSQWIIESRKRVDGWLRREGKWEQRLDSRLAITIAIANRWSLELVARKIREDLNRHRHNSHSSDRHLYSLSMNFRSFEMLRYCRREWIIGGHAPAITTLVTVPVCFAQYRTITMPMRFGKRDITHATRWKSCLPAKSHFWDFPVFPVCQISFWSGSARPNVQVIQRWTCYRWLRFFLSYFPACTTHAPLVSGIVLPWGIQP